MRNAWDMRFAERGDQALCMMEEEPFDVVVTDMRMPGMDGGDFLQQVMERHPNVVRIVLSGQSEQELVLKSVRPAHQYLSKPCDAETLRGTLERACTLQDLMGSESLKQFVSGIDSLPSLPSLYTEILEELKSPQSSIQRVGEIIGKDVGMTAKILQLVNSAFFGLPRHIETPAQAAALLGLDTVKALVLGIEVFSRFDSAALPGFDLESLWHHSMAAAAASRAIARVERLPKEQTDDAFMAGLLHDVGKLLMADGDPEGFGRVLNEARDPEVLSWEMERSVFGTSHAEIGAYLLGLWGLPEGIVEAVAFHHTPLNHPDRILSPISVVHAANALFKAADDIIQGDDNHSGIDLQYLGEVGVVDRLVEWEKACQVVMQGEPRND